MTDLSIRAATIQHGSGGKGMVSMVHFSKTSVWCQFIARPSVSSFQTVVSFCSVYLRYGP